MCPGACAETLSELLLHGVRQRDVHSRHRALHLITAAVQAGQAPTVGSKVVQMSKCSHGSQQISTRHIFWSESFLLATVLAAAAAAGAAGL